MSIKNMTVIRELYIPQTPKMILTLFADVGNDDGESIFPSKEFIAARCSISISTVKRTLKDLERLGAIACVENQNGGRGKSRVWRICIERIQQLYDHVKVVERQLKGEAPDPAKGVHGEPLSETKRGSELDPLSAPGKGVTDDPKGVHWRPERGSELEPLTIKNHEEPCAREEAGCGEAASSARQPSNQPPPSTGDRPDQVEAEPIGKHFAACKARIEQAMGESAFRSWIEPGGGKLAIAEYDDGQVMVISIGTPLMAKFLAENFGNELEQILDRRIMLHARGRQHFETIVKRIAFYADLARRGTAA